MSGSLLFYGNVAPLTPEDAGELGELVDDATVAAMMLRPLAALTPCQWCTHYATHSGSLAVYGGTCADCPACAILRSEAPE